MVWLFIFSSNSSSEDENSLMIKSTQGKKRSSKLKVKESLKKKSNKEKKHRQSRARYSSESSSRYVNLIFFKVFESYKFQYFLPDVGNWLPFLALLPCSKTEQKPSWSLAIMKMKNTYYIWRQIALSMTFCF